MTPPELSPNQPTNSFSEVQYVNYQEITCGDDKDKLLDQSRKIFPKLMTALHTNNRVPPHIKDGHSLFWIPPYITDNWREATQVEAGVYGVIHNSKGITTEHLNEEGQLIFIQEIVTEDDGQQTIFFTKPPIENDLYSKNTYRLRGGEKDQTTLLVTPDQLGQLKLPPEEMLENLFRGQGYNWEEYKERLRKMGVPEKREKTREEEDEEFRESAKWGRGYTDWRA